MLSIKTVRKAEELCGVLDYNSRSLAPKPHTPLSTLIESVQGVDNTVTPEDLVRRSQFQNTVDGTHTELESAIAKKVARIIEAIQRRARVEINPRIKEIIETITEERESSVRKLGGEYRIEMIDIAPVFRDPIMDVFLKGGNELAYNLSDADKNHAEELLIQVLDSISDTERLDLIASGSAAFDAKVSTYLAEYDASNAQLKQGLVFTNLPSMLASFLTITSLLNGRLDKASAFLNGDEDRTVMLRVRNVLVARISRGLEAIDSATRRGDLLWKGTMTPGLASTSEPSTPKERRVIRVLGPNYRTWVKGLGSPEALYGFYARYGDRVPSMAQIKELRDAPEQFLVDYQARQRTATLKAQANDHRTVQQVTQNLCRQHILDHIEDLEGTDVDGTRTALMQNLAEARKLPYVSDRDSDILNYVRSVVCRVWAPDSDVEMVLCEMDRVSELQDEGLSEEQAVQQARYLTFTRLAARWVVAQLEG